MTDKELRHMSRRELLELLVEQTERNEQLQQELSAVREELNTRRIAIQQSGTMAEAALRLSGVFEAADRAANQYLELLRQRLGACTDGDERNI